MLLTLLMVLRTEALHLSIRELSQCPVKSASRADRCLRLHYGRKQLLQSFMKLKNPKLRKQRKHHLLRTSPEMVCLGLS